MSRAALILRIDSIDIARWRLSMSEAEGAAYVGLARFSAPHADIGLVRATCRSPLRGAGHPVVGPSVAGANRALLRHRRESPHRDLAGVPLNPRQIVIHLQTELGFRAAAERLGEPRGRHGIR